MCLNPLFAKFHLSVILTVRVQQIRSDQAKEKTSIHFELSYSKRAQFSLEQIDAGFT